jgi:hypothetical protein
MRTTEVEQQTHTADKLEACGHLIRTARTDASPEGWLIAECAIGSVPGVANAERIVKCWNSHDALVAIVRQLTLATNEGDDAAMGTHYVDRDGRILCKGSFLELIEQARAAIAAA